MNRKRKPAKRRFTKIYYIIQTAPHFKTCGHAFSKKTADFVAQQVYLLTGEPGHIIEFTRDELQRLGYKSYAESKNSKR